MTFQEVLKQMNEIHIRKNQDYGNSFENTMNEFGPVSGIIRLNDKMNRVKQLYKTGSQQVADEKIEDTLLDLANYAVMTLVWMKNNSSKE